MTDSHLEGKPLKDLASEILSKYRRVPHPQTKEKLLYDFDRSDRIHIVVEIKEKLLEIPRMTETTTAIVEFLEFYEDVKKHLKAKPNAQIVIEETQETCYEGIISRYIRCIMEDQITGGFLDFVFEHRISCDLLPKNWEELSLGFWCYGIKEFKIKYAEWFFTTEQFDFIVGYKNNENTVIVESTDKSYPAALARVKIRIDEIMFEHKSD
jgi:hypothetical protein